MIALERWGRKYEIRVRCLRDGGGYYAQTHCVCQSTMSSGEYKTTIDEAVSLAEDGIVKHEALCVKRHRVAAARMAETVGHADSVLEAQLAVSTYLAEVGLMRPPRKQGMENLT